MTPERFDAGSAECLVFTERAGLLSAIAHDLKLRVGRFEIEVGADSVSGCFDPASLRVVSALRGGREQPSALSQGDRRQIEANIAGEVLEAARYPEIRFASTSVESNASGVRVAGTLSLHGCARIVMVSGKRQGDRAVLETRLHQPDFGIRPYSAMAGALRVKPEVTVRLSLPLPDR